MGSPCNATSQSEKGISRRSAKILTGFGGVSKVSIQLFDKQVKHFRVMTERVLQKIFHSPSLPELSTKKKVQQHF